MVSITKYRTRSYQFIKGENLVALNLMNSAHKTTNENYRKHYDETFAKKKKGKKDVTSKQEKSDR